MGDKGKGKASPPPPTEQAPPSGDDLRFGWRRIGSNLVDTYGYTVREDKQGALIGFNKSGLLIRCPSETEEEISLGWRIEGFVVYDPGGHVATIKQGSGDWMGFDTNGNVLILANNADGQLVQLTNGVEENFSYVQHAATAPPPPPEPPTDGRSSSTKRPRPPAPRPTPSSCQARIISSEIITLTPDEIIAFSNLSAGGPGLTFDGFELDRDSSKTPPIEPISSPPPEPTSSQPPEPTSSQPPEPNTSTSPSTSVIDSTYKAKPPKSPPPPKR